MAHTLDSCPSCAGFLPTGEEGHERQPQASGRTAPAASESRALVSWRARGLAPVTPTFSSSSVGRYWREISSPSLSLSWHPHPIVSPGRPLRWSEVMKTKRFAQCLPPSNVDSGASMSPPSCFKTVSFYWHHPKPSSMCYLDGICLVGC